jgi:hypothetical protein
MEIAHTKARIRRILLAKLCLDFIAKALPKGEAALVTEAIALRLGSGYGA